MRRLAVLIRLAASRTFVIALGVACAANAQKSEPKAVPGRAVMAWQEDWDSSLTHLRVIYARNDSTAPLVIARVRFAKCVNLGLACGPFAPAIKVLAPGQTSRVVSVAPANLGMPLSFTFDLDWRAATECVVPRSPGAEPADGKTFPPQPAQMIIPNAGLDAPIRLRGKRVDVRFFVADNGKVDSVDITGIADKGFLTKFRSAMMRYIFSPALDRGCPVRGTTSIQVTF